MPIDEGHRSSDGSCCETLQCTVDKIARVAYDAANEAHRNGRLLSEINAALTKLVEMYEGSHPEQALELRRLETARRQDSALLPAGGAGRRRLHVRAV